MAELKEERDALQRPASKTSSAKEPVSNAVAPKPKWVSAIDRAIVPICLLVVLGSACLVLSFDYGRDQAIYALVAREILHGRMPYRDAFDFKPPGVFLVYALARLLFGPAQVGIRILEVVAMLTTALGLVHLAKVHFKSSRPGYIAAALASQMHAQLDFWHTAQPETFGGTLTLLGLCASTSALAATHVGKAKRAVPLWLLAGSLFGMAGLMKPPLAGAGAVIGALAALASLVPRIAPPEAAKLSMLVRLVRALTTLGATAVGGVLPFVVTLVWFKSKGALGDLHEVLFVFTPHYTKLSWENARFLGMAYYGFTEWLVAYSGAMLVGLIALGVARPKADEAPYVVAIASVIVMHIAGVVMQGKFFPYHWGATFPLTATLAGLGLDKALRWGASKGPIVTLVLASGFVAAAVAKAPVPNLGQSFLERAGRRAAIYVTGPMNQTERDSLASVADVDAAENRAVAEYLKQHTPPDKPVFVWGFECIIYDLADRPLASRYIYNVPQRATWSKEPMQRALMRELAANPPSAIVVEHNDVFGMVTGNNDDSAHSTFDGLTRLIDESYAFDKRIGDFDIYLRDERDHASTEGPAEP